MNIAIALYDRDTGMPNGHTADMTWDDLGVIVNGSRFLHACLSRHPGLETIITAGASFTVQVIEFSYALVALKPYSVSCGPSYRLYAKTHPEPVRTATTPQALAQMCKGLNIRYEQIENRMYGPDWQLFRTTYRDAE